MSPPKLRVLVDLSMAARGFCGIAQDVRLLYKTLASCGDIEVTGLVYQPRKLAVLHKFLPADAPLGDRLENQARFLWALAGGEVGLPGFGSLRMLSQARRLAGAVSAYRARLDRLQVDAFWRVVWRSLFAQTLGPEDIPIVRGGRFLLSNVSDGMIYARALSGRRPFRLDTRGYDYLIVQGPRPFRVSPETRVVVRYQDMIPVLDPDTMSNPWVIAWHHKAIRQCAQHAFFVCNSEPTHRGLTGVHPQLAPHSATIPSIPCEVYRPDCNPHRLHAIIGMRRSDASGAAARKPLPRVPRYVMCVSTLEPRKNFPGLIQAFYEVKYRAASQQRLEDLKLVIVGSPGSKCKPILEAMRVPVASGDVIHLERVSAEELRVLYTHAQAFVSPSYAEGFGIPPLEAMRCGAPVVASDIGAHRWVLGDAALYCNPFDTASIAEAIEQLVASEDSIGLRRSLIARGHEQMKRYTVERCAKQWRNLLLCLKDESSRAIDANLRPFPNPPALDRVA